MIDIIAPNPTGTIRQLTNEDFDAMYQIWEDGIAAALTNPALTGGPRRRFYRQFYRDALERQDRNFKIWGYFNSQRLVGWQSVLPCQSAPMMWHKFAELSTYVAPGNRERGIGRNLLLHAIADAKSNSELAYLLGFVSEANLHVQRLVQEVGFQRIAPLPRSQKDDVLGRLSGGEVSSRLIVYCIAL